MRRYTLLFSYLLLLLLLVVLLLTIAFLLDDYRAGEPIHLQSPAALLLCSGGLLLIVSELHWQRERRASFWFSRISSLAAAPRGWSHRVAQLPAILRVAAVVLIALALARPQTFTEEERTTEGIDVIFVLDLSRSMEASDLPPSRLEAGKRTLRRFLHLRSGKGDRVGLIVFAREAMLQCPMTLDYEMLDGLVSELQIGDVPEEGTAIGDALGLALGSLRRSESSSKVIIMLSDGDWNRATHMDPVEAKKLSAQMGVRIFTVLMGAQSGNDGDSGGYEVNPALLSELARDTDGLSLMAENSEMLSSSFDSIVESLEKSERRVMGKSAHLELFHYFLWPALMLLLIEFILRMTRFRAFP